MKSEQTVAELASWFGVHPTMIHQGRDLSFNVRWLNAMLSCGNPILQPFHTEEIPPAADPLSVVWVGKWPGFLRKFVRPTNVGSACG